MTYFNGTQHGFNSSAGYVPSIPTTETYCDSCAPSCIEKWNDEKPEGRKHWDSDFKWAPWAMGKCNNCKKDTA